MARVDVCPNAFQISDLVMVSCHSSKTHQECRYTSQVRHHAKDLQCATFDLSRIINLSDIRSAKGANVDGCTVCSCPVHV